MSIPADNRPLPPGPTRDTLVALAKLLARRAAKRQSAAKPAANQGGRHDGD